MNQNPPSPLSLTSRRKAAVLVAALAVWSGLAACLTYGLKIPTQTPAAVETAVPSLAPSTTVSATSTRRARLAPWQEYPPPSLPLVTAVPPPVQKLNGPPDLQVLALLGTDSDAPYTARTDAVLLLLYSPKNRRAALLSLPPDWMVYIPGYTMQRLQVAYAIGGADGLSQTLEYNLGLKPTHWALVHLNDFSRLVDELGGVRVNVLEDDPELCGGLKEGMLQMDGEQALCYVRWRSGSDEFARNRRQQEILWKIFFGLVENGNLIKLTSLFETYGTTVESSLRLEDLLKLAPLALEFGDPQRLKFYTLAEEDLTVWALPGQSAARVFLVNPEGVQRTLSRVISFLSEPSASSNYVATVIRAATLSATPTDTPTPTNTLTRTVTPYPTITQTPTVTFTRTPSRTVTETKTPTTPPTETETPTLTLAPP